MAITVNDAKHSKSTTLRRSPRLSLSTTTTISHRRQQARRSSTVSSNKQDPSPRSLRAEKRRNLAHVNEQQQQQQQQQQQSALPPQRVLRKRKAEPEHGSPAPRKRRKENVSEKPVRKTRGKRKELNQQEVTSFVHPAPTSTNSVMLRPRRPHADPRGTSATLQQEHEPPVLNEPIHSEETVKESSPESTDSDATVAVVVILEDQVKSVEDATEEEKSSKVNQDTEGYNAVDSPSSLPDKLKASINEAHPILKPSNNETTIDTPPLPSLSTLYVSSPLSPPNQPHQLPSPPSPTRIAAQPPIDAVDLGPSPFTLSLPLYASSPSMASSSHPSSLVATYPSPSSDHMNYLASYESPELLSDAEEEECRRALLMTPPPASPAYNNHTADAQPQSMYHHHHHHHDPSFLAFQTEHQTVVNDDYNRALRESEEQFRMNQNVEYSIYTQAYPHSTPPEEDPHHSPMFQDAGFEQNAYYNTEQHQQEQQQYYYQQQQGGQQQYQGYQGEMQLYAPQQQQGQYAPQHQPSQSVAQPQPQQQQQQPQQSERKKVKAVPMWVTACKMRVGEIKRLYSLKALRSFVEDQAVDFFLTRSEMMPVAIMQSDEEEEGVEDVFVVDEEEDKHKQTDDGFLHEEYYDWEIASDEDDDDEEDDEEGDEDEGGDDVSTATVRKAWRFVQRKLQSVPSPSPSPPENSSGLPRILTWTPRPSRLASEVVPKGSPPSAMEEEGIWEEVEYIPTSRDRLHPDLRLDMDLEEGDEDAEGEMDVELEALKDPSFNAELSSPTSPTSPASPHSPGDTMMSSFYVGVRQEMRREVKSRDREQVMDSLPPVNVPLQAQQYEPEQQQQQQQQQFFQHQEIQIDSAPPAMLPLPPPRLSSVRVGGVRALEIQASYAGRGTPIHRPRTEEWGGVWGRWEKGRLLGWSGRSLGVMKRGRSFVAEGEEGVGEFEGEEEEEEGEEGERKPGCGVLLRRMPGPWMPMPRFAPLDGQQLDQERQQQQQEQQEQQQQQHKQQSQEQQQQQQLEFQSQFEQQTHYAMPMEESGDVEMVDDTATTPCIGGDGSGDGDGREGECMSEKKKGKQRAVEPDPADVDQPPLAPHPEPQSAIPDQLQSEHQHQQQAPFNWTLFLDNVRRSEEFSSCSGTPVVEDRGLEGAGAGTGTGAAASSVPRPGPSREGSLGMEMMAEMQMQGMEVGMECDDGRADNANATLSDDVTHTQSLNPDDDPPLPEIPSASQGSSVHDQQQQFFQHSQETQLQQQHLMQFQGQVPAHPMYYKSGDIPIDPVLLGPEGRGASSLAYHQHQTADAGGDAGIFGMGMGLGMGIGVAMGIGIGFAGLFGGASGLGVEGSVALEGGPGVEQGGVGVSGGENKKATVVESSGSGSTLSYALG